MSFLFQVNETVGLTSLVMLVSILRSDITFRMPSLIAASLFRPLFSEAASPVADVTCGF